MASVILLPGRGGRYANIAAPPASQITSRADMGPRAPESGITPHSLPGSRGVRRGQRLGCGAVAFWVSGPRRKATVDARQRDAHDPAHEAPRRGCPHRSPHRYIPECPFVRGATRIKCAQDVRERARPERDDRGRFTKVGGDRKKPPRTPPNEHLKYYRNKRY